MEALIAEVLGDVVQLNRVVEELKASLPATVGKIEERLVAVASRLESAGKKAEQSIAAQADSVRLQLSELEGSARRKPNNGGPHSPPMDEAALRTFIARSVGVAILEEVKPEIDSLTDAIHDATATVSQTRNWLMFYTLLAGMVGAFVGGGAAIYALENGGSQSLVNAVTSSAAAPIKKQ
jgi:hypothetical protein